MMFIVFDDLILSGMLSLLICSVGVIVLVGLIDRFHVKASPVTSYVKNGCSRG